MAIPTATRFTRLFDLEVPLVQAPMGGVAGPQLVAAVADSGALGVLPIWYLPVADAVAVIRATQAETAKPFAVNVRADLVQLEHIAAALEAGVPVVHLFWGDPAPSMGPIRERGARMMATVWDRDSTRRALDAGAAALLAQGVEAGGHVIGTTPLAELVAMVRELAGDVPVAAAGGLADAGDVARVLAHGADAAALGTRFAATVESAAHDAYKQALIETGGDATVRSTCFDDMWPDAPHRTLQNSTFRMWDAAGRPAPGSRPGEGDVIFRGPHGQPVTRYSMALPTGDMTGDVEAGALYAGSAVGRIADLPAVADLVRTLMDR